MKLLRRPLVLLSLMLLTVLTFRAFADAATDATFFSQVLELIKGFGGMSWVAKIAAISLLVVGSMKVSFIAPLWDKLPDLAKTLAGPAVGLIAGIVSMGSSLTFASALAYVSAGAGAVILHELLDGVKTIPGIGAIYVTAINFIESMLGAPKA